MFKLQFCTISLKSLSLFKKKKIFIFTFYKRPYTYIQDILPINTRNISLPYIRI